MGVASQFIQQDKGQFSSCFRSAHQFSYEELGQETVDEEEVFVS